LKHLELATIVRAHARNGPTEGNSLYGEYSEDKGCGDSQKESTGGSSESSGKDSSENHGKNGACPESSAKSDAEGNCDN
jgi:hypothetical protein